MITFKQFLDEALEHQAGSETTQVATTTGTYQKTAEKIKGLMPTGGAVLDYGAGLGEGTRAMAEILKDRAVVHGYEPSPGRAKQKPNFTDPEDIKGQYDAVVSHNVLNVLEPELRHQVTKHILGLIKPEGHAIIGTRKWTGDVNAAKNAEPADEEKAIWITKKTKSGPQKVYQKGFDKNELQDYIKGLAGEDFEVKRLPGIAANAVQVKRLK